MEIEVSLFVLLPNSDESVVSGVDSLVAPANSWLWTIATGLNQ